MSAPLTQTYQYCEHCLCTRDMKILDGGGTQCLICGTEKPPRVKIVDTDWKKQGEIEAAWQTDWGNE